MDIQFLGYVNYSVKVDRLDENLTNIISRIPDPKLIKEINAKVEIQEIEPKFDLFKSLKDMLPKVVIKIKGIVNDANLPKLLEKTTDIEESKIWEILSLTNLLIPLMFLYITLIINGVHICRKLKNLKYIL